MARAGAWVAMLLLAGGARADSTVPRAVERSCVAPGAVELQRARRAIQRAYSPSAEGCTLTLTPPACDLGGDRRRVVFEEGWGHGGQLRITELRRDGDGFALTRLTIDNRSGAGRSWGDEVPPSVGVERARLAVAPVEAALRLGGAAIGFRLEERPPPHAADSIAAMGSWSSSGDFWARARFDGGAEREYAGYPGSDSQLRYLPLRVAVDALEDTLAGAPLARAPLDDAARALYTEQLRANQVALDEPFHWWVRELYVGAAGPVGDPEVAPILRRWLAPRDGRDASNARTRVQAVSSLAQLTGRDLRFDPHGRARAVDAVAREYETLPLGE